MGTSAGAQHCLSVKVTWFLLTLSGSEVALGHQGETAGEVNGHPAPGGSMSHPWDRGGTWPHGDPISPPADSLLPHAPRHRLDEGTCVSITSTIVSPSALPEVLEIQSPWSNAFSQIIPLGSLLHSHSWWGGGTSNILVARPLVSKLRSPGWSWQPVFL